MIDLDTMQRRLDLCHQFLTKEISFEDFTREWEAAEPAAMVATVSEPAPAPTWAYAEGASPFRKHEEVPADPLALANDGHPQGE